jgi:hypothetical protein
MKKIHLLLCSLLLTAALQAQVPADSLEAWYPFNGNALDESGHGHDGTINKVLRAKDRCNEQDKALFFPYKGGSIKLKNTGNLNLSGEAFSIVLWFKQFDFPYNSGVQFGGPVISNYYAPKMDTGFFITIGYGGVDFKIHDSMASTKVNHWDTAWHLVVATADGQSMMLYIDGEFMGSAQYTIPPANVNDILLGYIGGGDYYNGFFDDVRIYRRVITETEVQVFNNEKPFPVVIYESPENKTLCLHNPLACRVRTSGSQPVQFQWQLEGTDIPGATSKVYTLPNVQPADSGHYNCIASNSLNTYHSDTARISILYPLNTYILGKTEVKKDETAVYSVTSHPGYSYDFSVAGGTIIDSTLNSIKVRWNDPGQGKVKMVETADNVCTHDTLMLPVTVGSAGLNDASLSRFSVRPNPVRNMVTFSYMLESACRVVIAIFDTFGQETGTPSDLYQQPGQHQVTHDLRDLPAGFYFYRIRAGNWIESGKLVKY